MEMQKDVKIEGTNSVKSFRINQSVKKRTQNELVFECKLKQNEPQKAPKNRLLRGIELIAHGSKNACGCARAGLPRKHRIGPYWASAIPGRGDSVRGLRRLSRVLPSDHRVFENPGQLFRPKGAGRELGNAVLRQCAFDECRDVRRLIAELP